MLKTLLSYLSYIARALLVLAIDLASFTFIYRIYFSLSHWENRAELLFILLLLSYLILLFSVLSTYKSLWRVALRNLFPKDQSKFGWLCLGALLALAFYLTRLMLTFPFGEMEWYPFGVVKAYNHFSPLCLVILITYSFVGSLTEEVVYRGYVQSELMGSLGLGFALITTSTIFMARHVKLFAPLPDLDLLLFFLLFGVFVGFLFYETGSLYAPTSFHVCFNLINILIPMDIMVSHSLHLVDYLVTPASWVLLLFFFFLLMKTKTFEGETKTQKCIAIEKVLISQRSD